MTTELPTHPADFANTFALNFNTGDVDVVVGGYAEDALLDVGGGQGAQGLGAVRAVLANFLGAGLPIVVTPGRATVNGDLAVVTFDWSIEGTGPDGAPVRLGGAAIDVLRRGADGHWRQLIDLPFGSATPS